jgi:branched-chain amino acid transport system permease protein
MIAGALIGWLVLRLAGPYLALFTLAIAEIFRLILVAEQELTRGSLGLQVPVLFVGHSDLPYYYLGLGLVVASLLFMGWLLHTRIGLFLRAIREDEAAARATGVNTTSCKILVFVVTSALTGLAGIYYAHFIGILTPSVVILPEMGLVIAMAVIGGIESLPGAVVGAVLVYALSEIMRDYGQWRFVLLGLALILVQRFAQNGLFALLERPLRQPAARITPRPDATMGTPHVGQ